MYAQARQVLVIRCKAITLARLHLNTVLSNWYGPLMWLVYLGIEWNHIFHHVTISFRRFVTAHWWQVYSAHSSLFIRRKKNRTKILLCAEWVIKVQPLSLSQCHQIKFCILYVHVVSELIPNDFFYCVSLHWVSVFLHVLLNHLRFLF